MNVKRHMYLFVCIIGILRALYLSFKIHITEYWDNPKPNKFGDLMCTAGYNGLWVQTWDNHDIGRAYCLKHGCVLKKKTGYIFNYKIKNIYFQKTFSSCCFFFLSTLLNMANLHF